MTVKIRVFEILVFNNEKVSVEFTKNTHKMRLSTETVTLKLNIFSGKIVNFRFGRHGDKSCKPCTVPKKYNKDASRLYAELSPISWQTMYR